MWHSWPIGKPKKIGGSHHNNPNPQSSAKRSCLKTSKSKQHVVKSDLSLSEHDAKSMLNLLPLLKGETIH